MRWWQAVPAPSKVVTSEQLNEDPAAVDTTYRARSTMLGGQVIWENGPFNVYAGGTRIAVGSYYWMHEDANGHTLRSTDPNGNVQGSGSLPEAYWDKKELDSDGKQTGFSVPVYYPLEDNDLFAPMSNFGVMSHGQYTSYKVDGINVPADFFAMRLGGNRSGDLGLQLLLFSVRYPYDRENPYFWRDSRSLWLISLIPQRQTVDASPPDSGLQSEPCVFNINLKMPKGWEKTDTTTTTNDPRLGTMTEEGELRRFKKGIQKIFEAAGVKLVFNDPKAASNTRNGSFNLKIVHDFSLYARGWLKLTGVDALGWSRGSKGEASVKKAGMANLPHVGAHEAGHYFLEDFDGLDDEGHGAGVMDAEVNNLGFTPEQAAYLRSLCPPKEKKKK